MSLDFAELDKSVKDDFKKKYFQNNGSPIIGLENVFISFEGLGVPISDSDFYFNSNLRYDSVNNNYLESKAKERFSDLVNRWVDIGGENGENSILSDRLIDAHYYLNILQCARPYIDPGLTNKKEKNDIITAFNRVYNDSIKQLENYKIASYTGIPDGKILSIANPERWFDSFQTTQWTNYTRKLSEPTQIQKIELPTETKWNWKLKINNDIIRSVLVKGNINNNFNSKILKIQSPGIKKSTNSVSNNQAQVASTIQPSLVKLMSLVNFEPNFAIQNKEKGGEKKIKSDSLKSINDIRNELSANINKFSFHDDIITNSKKVDLVSRLQINNILSLNLVNAQVKSNTLTITFDYLIVHITRPWLQAFLYNDEWYIPGKLIGEFSDNSLNTKVNKLYSAVPSACILVKNLTIDGNWTSDDKNDLEEATGFGPFTIDKPTNEVTHFGHTGIQIIGWINTLMPVLPPNSDPNLTLKND